MIHSVSSAQDSVRGLRPVPLRFEVIRYGVPALVCVVAHDLRDRPVGQLENR